MLKVLQIEFLRTLIDNRSGHMSTMLWYTSTSVIILAVVSSSFCIIYYVLIITGIWIYDFVGKRLFGPMVIWIMLSLLSLVGCVVLYKQLGPRDISQRIKKSEDIKVNEQVAQKCEEHTINGNTSRASIIL